MLELYHWEPNAASARVMIALEEKGLEYSSRYVDVLRFEQHTREFTALNEAGQVPVLVRAGLTYTDASLICEYLEEAFPAEALIPADPLGRWRVRVWQKLVDDTLAAAVSELAWQAYGLPALRARGLDADRLQSAIARISAHDRREAWKAAIVGFEAERLAHARHTVAAAIATLEADLEGSSWLAGPGYSLADIAVFAYLSYVPSLCPDVLNDRASPRLMAWIRKLGARPAVRAALTRGRLEDPFAIAAPGPEHVRWG
jgi:glutathione S-transferase